MLSGEIYLRLKPYLVVKISSDIVTEHCCEVCVLSIMFAAPTAGYVLTWQVIAQSGNSSENHVV